MKSICWRLGGVFSLREVSLSRTERGGQRPTWNLEFCRKICDIKNAHKKGVRGCCLFDGCWLDHLVDDKTGTLELNEVLGRKCLSLASWGGDKILTPVSPLTALMIPDNLRKVTLIPGNGVNKTQTENGTESTKVGAEKDVILSNCAIFLRRLSDKIMTENLPLKCQNGLDICIILTILPEPSIRVSRAHAINKSYFLPNISLSLGQDKKSCSKIQLM